MKHKVLIAGAGQLGSRYLQGLAKSTLPLDIVVFDPSPESLARAEQRWQEMQPTAEHLVSYVSDLATLPPKLDLVIVATTADMRAGLVEEIRRHAEVSNWVLEKVLAQSTGELNRLKRAIGDGDKAWVNTPMYQWPLYQQLRQLYTGTTPVHANFSGFRGLACNAIHYVDFVSRWNGAAVTRVDASDLHPEWYPAKREGFFEIDGGIRVEFADGSILALSSDRNNLGYKVTLKVGDDEWQVSEVDGTARAADGRVVEGGVAFQSQLTAPMTEAIFSGKPCGLPTLDESIQQHTLFLDALLAHWIEHMPNKLDRLPIT